MWTSFGNKYDINSHDEKKHPRKFKGNAIIIITAIVFIINIWFMLRDTSPPGVRREYYYLQFIINILCTLSFAGVGFWKWKKNDKELDIGVLIIVFLLINIVIHDLMIP